MIAFALNHRLEAVSTRHPVELVEKGSNVVAPDNHGQPKMCCSKLESAIGDTPALIEESGGHKSYRQRPGGPDRQFTVSDIGKTSIDETHGNELASMLSGQFQWDDHFYLFEFSKEGRTGYVHEWRSEPFAISGHELSNRPIGNANTVFELEDLLILGDARVLNRDSSASCMRPKSQSKVATDMKLMEEELGNVGKSTFALRIKDGKGEVLDIELPFEPMAETIELGIFSR